MENSNGLLGRTFKKALQEAATLDTQGVNNNVELELFPDCMPRNNVERVTACADFYEQYRTTIDAGIRGAVEFLQTPHGVAHVKAMQASFENQAPNQLSFEIASKIYNSDEFRRLKSLHADDGLKGIGIGVSVGAALPAKVLGGSGVFAGADIVFEKEVIVPRAWAGYSYNGAGSLSAGLELSYFSTTPSTGVTMGTLVDAYFPLPDFPLAVLVRVTLIEQRLTKDDIFTPCGIAVQLPLGVEWPVGQLITSSYWAWQATTQPKPQLATLDISPSQVVSNVEPTKLTIALKNTSGRNIDLKGASNIIITFPFFQPTEIENMQIDLRGWSASSKGNQWTLTLNADWSWEDQTTIAFDVINAATNTQPQSGGYQAGIFNLLLNYGAKFPLVKNTEFDLVSKIQKGNIIWAVDLGPNPDRNWTIVSGQTAQGNQDLSLIPSEKFQQLTIIRDAKSKVDWMLGYKFNGNLLFYAAWYKSGSLAPIPGFNFYQGNSIKTSGTTTCFNQAVTDQYPVLNIDLTLQST